MNWDEHLIVGLDCALNEATPCGLRYDAVRDEARLLLEVEALPEHGPIDSDPRRVIVCSSLGSVDVTLRVDHAGEYGPVLPLASFDELEDFFVGLSWAHSMYGWEFVDVSDPSEAWRVESSLHVQGGPDAGAHSLRWFTECGRHEADGSTSYALQGVIRFDELAVERADGSSVALDEFIADGERWWSAFSARDQRLSVASQRSAEAVSLRWRSWGMNATSTIVPAGSWGD